MPTPSETGAKLKYDIRELRLRPERITKWYKGLEDEEYAQQEKGNQKKKENDAQDWALYETQIGEAPQQLYPLRKKKGNPAEPELVTALGMGGTGNKTTRPSLQKKKRSRARNRQAQPKTTIPEKTHPNATDPACMETSRKIYRCQ